MPARHTPTHTHQTQQSHNTLTINSPDLHKHRHPTRQTAIKPLIEHTPHTVSPSVHRDKTSQTQQVTQMAQVTVYTPTGHTEYDRANPRGEIGHKHNQTSLSLTDQQHINHLCPADTGHYSAAVAANPLIQTGQTQKLQKKFSTSLKVLQVRPTQAFLRHKQGYLTRPSLTAAAKQSRPHLAQIYETVAATKRPNHEEARIRLTHSINVSAWRQRLPNYKDEHLFDQLQFGFPLGFMTNVRPGKNTTNHQSARQHPEAIAKYLDTETRHKAIAGPFPHPPFAPWFHVSPMIVRDKRDSSDKRVIVDLSWPKGDSVNSNIPCDTYQGHPMTMRLPTPEDLATAIIKAPPTAHIFSLDLSRAYRQLRIDPLDWPLLGLQWDQSYFFDLALAFGGRWHAAACQRVTTALRDILADMGIQVWPYLDDIVGIADTEQLAHEHFHHIRTVMEDLGLQEAKHKAFLPTQKLVWIGIQFDIRGRTMTMPQHKIMDAVQSTHNCLHSRSVTFTQFQQLTGRLAHIVKCCPIGRLFMGRLYDAIANNRHIKSVTITTDVALDLLWFNTMLPLFCGVRLIRPLHTHVTVMADSCLTGGGALTHQAFYTLQYSQHILQRNMAINLLEMYNILIAVRMWHTSWRNRNVMIFSDNAATVATLQAGRAHHPYLRAAAREIWCLAAASDTHLTIRHRPGASTDMTQADALSRAHLSTHFRQTVQDLTDKGIPQVTVPELLTADPSPFL